MASFNDLEDDTAGTLSLQFAAPGVPEVISNPSTVSPGPAAALKVVGKPPSGVIAGITFAGLVVDVMDNYNNLETGFNAPVTAALASGSDGTLGGTPTVTAVDGEATFNDLVADTSGTISLMATTNATGTNLTSPSTNPVVVSPAPADHFVVTTTFANPDVAGTAGSITVIAEDQFGNIANSGQNQYVGLVNLSTTDRQATGLPSTYSFTAGDDGSHTFQNVVLETAGSQTMTATDSSNSATAGTSQAVNVVPAAVNRFVVSTSFTNPDVAGTVGTVTVTAKDSYGNTVGSGPNQYLGILDLSSTDARSAGLAATHTFTASDAGSYTFAGVALKTAGLQTITAADASNQATTGNTTINVVSAPIVGLVVSTNFSTTDDAGTVGTLTIMALDAYGNLANGGPNQYEDTVELSCTDSRVAGLPSSYTFTAGDDGLHTFTNVVLVTAGSQTVTVTDALNHALTDTTNVSVVPAVLKDFVVTTTLPNPDIAGTVGTVTVTAKDAYGNTVGAGPNQYQGTVELSSTASQATTLPSSHTMTTGDAGTYTFTGVALETAGAQTITATDSVDNTVTGGVIVSVVAAPVFDLVVSSSFATTDVAGTVGLVTIAAKDQYGNVAGSGPNQYFGTVDIGDTDNQAAGLPISYAFLAGDAGSHTFNDVILKTAGNQSITVNDSVIGALTGLATVNVIPAAVNGFVVTTTFADPDAAGTVGTVTVTAKDAYGNPVGSGPNQYVGTVDLSGTDAWAAGLAASHSFTTSDAGSYTFGGVALKTAGPQTITAADASNQDTTGNTTINVVAAAVASLAVSTNYSTADDAGALGSVTIMALDAYGNVASGGANPYEGTVGLTSTDSRATGLPTSYTFTAGDDGLHTFTNVVLETAGSQTVTVTDALNHTLTGTANISVVPAAVKNFVVTTTLSSSDTAGAVGTVTVTAKDAYGNTAGSGPNQYRGTVELNSTASQAAGLPSSQSFTIADAGSYTFTGVALDLAGTQTITATDSVDNTVTGGVSVSVVSAPVFDLVVSSSFATTDVAGTVGSVTIAAKDRYGNVAGSGPNQYVGTVDISDTDNQAAGLPISYTLLAGDAGAHTFNDVILKTAGNQSITGHDSGNPGITGTAAITVIPGAVADLLFTTPPPSAITAGEGFTVVVTAEDSFHNVDSGYNGDVTISLPGDSGLTTTIQAQNGVATFGGLSIATAGQFGSLEATSGKLSADTTSPITVARRAGRQ